jgi:cytochrome c-type biogenesis protein CcmE
VLPELGSLALLLALLLAALLGTLPLGGGHGGRADWMESAPFRLGGVVCEGSVRRTQGTLDVSFSVTDRVRQVPVRHNGILPDMFKEGTSIVATGRMDHGVFVAEKVLAKHDETYMPKEVSDAMAKGIAMHTKSCGAN